MRLKLNPGLETAPGPSWRIRISAPHFRESSKFFSSTMPDQKTNLQSYPITSDTSHLQSQTPWKNGEHQKRLPKNLGFPSWIPAESWLNPISGPIKPQANGCFLSWSIHCKYPVLKNMLSAIHIWKNSEHRNHQNSRLLCGWEIFPTRQHVSMKMSKNSTIGLRGCGQP